MTCRKCGSSSVTIQAVSETKKRGCLITMFYLLLLLIPVIGWIALFVLLRGKKSKTKNYAICQGCGKRWKA